MSFAHPWNFLLLLVVAGLVAGYLLAQRAKKRNTLRFANLELLERVMPKRQGWWRFAPVALLLVGMLLLVVALAGPQAQQKVPRNRATVMLVIDVSLSMKATDVAPTRLAAAQAAAKQFADDLTPGVNLGLLSFAASATILVSPTTERTSVKQAIDNLHLAEATATGEAVFAALNGIESFSTAVGGVDGAPPARIVLMSDGKQTVPSQDTSGPRGAFTAAKQAKEKGVPISAISFGTRGGSIVLEGAERPVPVDDESLEQIGKLSGGQFYKAASAEQLRQVYATLGEQIGYEIKQTDASRPWLLFGVLSLIVAIGGALAIGHRLPT
ncbi:VWA domain-containing protein [Pseudonocardiaceae bacterium YIM PH 21723]|nr:VWA domain-containing protein [Pseudonocardiaceae bacterium YIM PH 21723]